MAHPDDEVLGLGATIHMLGETYGCTIRAVILGEGITSRAETGDPAEWGEELKNHRKNIGSSCEKVGYDSVGIYDFPDNRFDSVDLLDIVKTIEKEQQDFGPEFVFTHHGGDTNIDHQKTFESVIVANRPLPGNKVQGIFTFETPSSTEWQAPNHPNSYRPNFYVEVSEDNLGAKIAAMESYQYERRSYPHPRSPEALTILCQRNGIVIGAKLAETFTVIRLVARNQS